jgi:hypothetical protein
MRRIWRGSPAPTDDQGKQRFEPSAVPISHVKKKQHVPGATQSALVRHDGPSLDPEPGFEPEPGLDPEPGPGQSPGQFAVLSPFCVSQMPSLLHGLPIELPRVPQSCGHESISLTSHTPSPHVTAAAASPPPPLLLLEFDEQANGIINPANSAIARILDVARLMARIVLIEPRRSTRFACAIRAVRHPDSGP